MSQRRGTARRPVTQAQRDAVLAQVAAKSGQTLEAVTEHIREAVATGWLIETVEGWQAALPANVAPPDWEGPVT